MLIIENIALWYLADFNFQYKAQENVANSKIGQAVACKTLKLSENLYSVLKKMDKFYPDISSYSDGGVTLSFGSEFSRGFAVGAGITLIFDQNYILTHKSCEGIWEPGVPVYQETKGKF